MPLSHETYLPRRSGDAEERIYDSDLLVAIIDPAGAMTSDEAKSYARLFSGARRMAKAIQAACREAGIVTLGEDADKIILSRDLYDELENALDAATEEYSKTEATNAE